MDKLGFIVWHNGVCDKNITAVKDAAMRSGLDEEIVKEIKPKSAFIRAANALVKSGVLVKGNKGILKDKISDESGDITFQFSERNVLAGEATYPKQAVISFDSALERITVTASGLGLAHEEQLKSTVYSLFAQKGFTYSHIDFHGLLNKLFNKKTRRIMMRDGVYYVSQDQEELIKQVRAFYKDLGFSFSCVTVNSDDLLSKQDIYDSVIADIKKNMQGLQEELREIQEEQAKAVTQEEKEKLGISRTVGRNRFEQVKEDYKRYGKIAESLHDNLQAYIQDAGEYGKILVTMNEGPEAMIAAMQGNSIDPVFEILSQRALEAREMERQEKPKKFALLPGQRIEVVIDNEVVILDGDRAIPQI